jgi:FkbM family methyltransferase
MTIFLKDLKDSGYLNPLEMTIGIIGSRKINTEDEYGIQGWKYFAPKLTIYGFDADEDACDAANTALSEDDSVDWTEKHIPLALGNTCGNRTLYVTHEAMCSSLYPPNEKLLARYAGLQEVAGLNFSVEIETTTLDQFCKTENISNIDFLQIDVQGADLDVLEGAVTLLSRSVLGIQIEVEFAELYKGQPLFADIDSFLKSQNFTLLDIIPTHLPRARGLITSHRHSGQLLWGEAFYLRDPFISEVNDNLFQFPENILKLACIADILEFPDYAIELLEHLRVMPGQSLYSDLDSVIIKSLSNIEDFTNADLMQLPVIQNILSTSDGMQLPFRG